VEATEYLRAAAALIFTLSLIGLIAWAVRRFAPGLTNMAANPANARLAILERRMLDARHQLVLLRRDQAEHLVLLSAQGAPVVVESNIPQPEGKRT
jgi:flagellar protein FliO/FliZ